MRLNYQLGTLLLVGTFFITENACAQKFGDESVATFGHNNASVQAERSQSAERWSNRQRLQGNWWGVRTQPIEKKQVEKTSQKPKKAVVTPPKKVKVENPEDYQYKKVPMHLRPTLDGVKRGTSIIRPLQLDKNGNLVEEEPLIFLYYKDFSVSRLMSGTVTCSVRFEILTTLDRKLKNLSVRLRWPHMETALSFTDIPPNQPVHFDYALLGEGCYSMDKIPNIIVNRCRAKGYSQKQCAAKIRWIREK